MIAQREVEHLIMESARKDETGLGEVIGAMTARWPDVPRAAAIKVAADALEALLACGWVTLFRTRSGGDPQPKIPLPALGLQGVLFRQATWESPGTAAWAYSVRITAKGNREFNW